MTTNPLTGLVLVFLLVPLPAAGPVMAETTDLIRGREEAGDPPADPRRTAVRTNQQGADFRAPESAEAWRDRAAHLRDQMRVTLGLWPEPPRTPLQPKVYGRVERDGYTIEKVVLETLPGFTLAGNLYRPTQPESRKPGILCPHGHWEDGRVNPEVQMRCIRWAKLGCVVFMYDMVGYNDSKPFGHTFLNDRLDRWGLSLATLQTWNSLRALDWLATLPDVDAERLACTGESGGGTQTFLLTALDDRVTIAAPVVMVSEWFQGGCACENASGLRHDTDNVEFAALAAPRPMTLVGATGDWTKNTLTEVLPRLRAVYALVGDPSNVTGQVFDFPHNYNRTSRDAVYDFMAPLLLGPDAPDDTREGDQTPERPEDLLVFDADHPRPDDLKDPEALEADLIALRRRQLDQLAPGAESATWEAARAGMRTALRVRVGLENPPPASLETTEVRTVARDGLSIVHSVVGSRKTGVQIPVVRLAPSAPSGRLTVVFSALGKRSLADDEGDPSSLVAALLSRGHQVVGFDPLLIGEAIDPSAPAETRPETAHFETYNKSLAADRMQDLATVVSWARGQPGIQHVNVIGLDGAGPLALLARPSLEGVARTVAMLDGFDYGDGSGPIPPGLHLPGALQFGGLPAAAALTAPDPLVILGPGEGFASDWPERAYDLADARPLLHIDSEPVPPEDLARWIDTGEVWD